MSFRIPGSDPSIDDLFGWRDWSAAAAFASTDLARDIAEFAIEHPIFGTLDLASRAQIDAAVEEMAREATQVFDVFLPA